MKSGIKPVSIQALPNGNKGFQLSMRGDSGAEYEVMVVDGRAKLGLVQSPRTTKSLLAQGSASAESTWTRFAEIIRHAQIIKEWEDR